MVNGLLFNHRRVFLQDWNLNTKKTQKKGGGGVDFRFKTEKSHPWHIAVLPKHLCISDRSKPQWSGLAVAAGQIASGCHSCFSVFSPTHCKVYTSMNSHGQLCVEGHWSNYVHLLGSSWTFHITSYVWQSVTVRDEWAQSVEACRFDFCLHTFHFGFKSPTLQSGVFNMVFIILFSYKFYLISYK